MEIHVYYNPAPEEHFFISAHLTRSEAISFDNSTKGHRVIQQVLREIKPFPEGVEFTGQWKTLVLENGVLVRDYQVSWIDLDNDDWLNGEIWNTAWERQMSDALTEKLLYFSRLISDNYRQPGGHRSELAEFDKLIAEQVAYSLKQLEFGSHEKR